MAPEGGGSGHEETRAEGVHQALPGARLGSASEEPLETLRCLRGGQGVLDGSLDVVPAQVVVEGELKGNDVDGEVLKREKTE